jgi:osmotically-inducible protein OsmY
MKTPLLPTILLALCFGTVACNKNESTTGTGNNTGATAPDNTAVNKRDQDTSTLTPVDQSENADDIRITAEIRRAVLDDKSLSTNAHNAKIITAKGGMVTLRGVVNSAAERDSLETKAKAVNGVMGVSNQLEVKNP